MSKNAITHEEALKLICLLCMRKKKHTRKINENQKQLIKNYLIENIDFDDVRFPTVLCGTCCDKLRTVCPTELKSEINVFDHDKLKPINRTRSLTELDS